MDPDPAIFVIDLQDANQNQFFLYEVFLLLTLLKVHLQNFSKIKVKKKSQSSRNQGFSYFFCLVIEGSGTGSGSGSIPLTNGSGSGSRRAKKYGSATLLFEIAKQGSHPVI
jgi:hypothetical protein